MVTWHGEVNSGICHSGHLKDLDTCMNWTFGYGPKFSSIDLSTFDICKIRTPLYSEIRTDMSGPTIGYSQAKPPVYCGHWTGGKL